jgi:Rrf2 family protein
MLTQTSELGVNVLLYLGLRGKDRGPITPRQIAEDIGASPTYTAKVCGQLVKSDILRSQRGALGGITLARSPGELSLLQIVEACQGKILADYCNEITDKRRVCAYHAAMAELYQAITGVLGKWTLEALMARPRPALPAAIEGHCLITRGWSALQQYLENTEPATLNGNGKGAPVANGASKR